MAKRQRFVLAALVVAWLAFVVMASANPDFSAFDVVASAAFGVVLVALAAWRLGSNQAVDGYRGLSRSFWVIFASFGVAFAAMLLVAVLALPFIGYKAFDLMNGEWFWLVYVVLAIAAYPFVRKRLQ